MTLVECAGPCGETYLQASCVEVPSECGGPSQWFCSDGCLDSAREQQVQP